MGRGHGFEPQRPPDWNEPQPEAIGQVLATAAERITVAIEIAAADTSKIERVQRGID